MAGLESLEEVESNANAIEGGAYELLQRRLSSQAAELRNGASELNEQRQSRFGDTRFELLGSVRARTEHNCVPRDIANAGEHLLFGFNVYIGLKSQTSPTRGRFPTSRNVDRHMRPRPTWVYFFKSQRAVAPHEPHQH